jgi:transposase
MQSNPVGCGRATGTIGGRPEASEHETSAADSSIGLIRAVLLLALMQTPNRFRTRRQRSAYCGLALRTYSSGEYRIVGGQFKRSKKVLAARGLNISFSGLFF